MELLISSISSVRLVDSHKLTDYVGVCVCVCLCVSLCVCVCVWPVADDSAVSLCIRGGTRFQTSECRKQKSVENKIM